MKKKIFAVVYALVIILFARQALNVFYNSYILDRYDDKDYSYNLNLLLGLNCFEPYIAYFNNGNIYYMNGLYQEAADSYRQALTYVDLPKYRECKVRINLALALIKPLKPVQDYTTAESIDEALAVLYEARDVLLDDGCADDFNTGHSPKAQRLKNEIDELIRQLEEARNSNSPQSSDSSQSSDPSQTTDPSQSESSDPSDSSSSDTSQSGQTTPDTSGSESSGSSSSGSSSDGNSTESSQDSQTRPGQTSESDQSQTGQGSGTTTTLSFEEWESQMRESLYDQASAAYSERIDDLLEYEEAENGRYSGYEDIW